MTLNGLVMMILHVLHMSQPQLRAAPTASGTGWKPNVTCSAIELKSFCDLGRICQDQNVVFS